MGLAVFSKIVWPLDFLIHSGSIDGRPFFPCRVILRDFPNYLKDRAKLANIMSDGILRDAIIVQA